MSIKELHNQYKSETQSMFSDKFKSDLIDIVTSIYGEEFRDKFERNMENIVIHTKFNIDDKKINEEYIPYSSHISDLESSLEETRKSAENLKKKNIINAQKKLLLSFKKDLSQEDANQLQTILDKMNNDDLFNLDDIQMEFAKFFYGVDDFTVLLNLVNQHELNKLSNIPNPSTDIQQYIKEKEDAELEFIRSTTNYDEILEEFSDVDLGDLSIIEELQTQSAGHILLRNKNTGKMESHIFISEYKTESERLGKLTHEILHGLEHTEKEIDGQTQVRTGFIEFNDERKNVMTSECIHNIILQNRIFPALQKLNYDIKDTSEYGLFTKVGLYQFFDKYENQILRSRCQEDLHELYDVVGKDNFDKLVEAQNSEEYSLQNDIVSSMEEYSVSKIAERIGKYTLSMQKNISGKNSISSELRNLLEQERGDFSNAD